MKKDLHNICLPSLSLVLSNWSFTVHILIYLTLKWHITIILHIEFLNDFNTSVSIDFPPCHPCPSRWSPLRVDQLPPHPAENRAERFEAFHPSPLSPKTADKRLTKTRSNQESREKSWKRCRWIWKDCHRLFMCDWKGITSAEWTSQGHNVRRDWTCSAKCIEVSPQSIAKQGEAIAICQPSNLCSCALASPHIGWGVPWIFCHYSELGQRLT